MSLPKRVLYFSRDLTTHDFRFLTSLANTALDVYYLRLEKQNASLQENSLPKKVIPGDPGFIDIMPHTTMHCGIAIGWIKNLPVT